jgi:hypothetical protein
MKPWQSEPIDEAQQFRLGLDAPVEGSKSALAEWWPNGACKIAKAALLVAAGCVSVGCFPSEEERLSCSDVYAPGNFDYRVLEDLIRQDELETSKGCLAAPCHSAGTQRGGVRLDTSELIYDELSTRPETYYEALASGYMPHDGIPWDDEELKIFRSWYCAGAFAP